MKYEKITVLGYASSKFLTSEWAARVNRGCYWCGRREDEIALRPFRMIWRKIELVNLACRRCYREFSGLVRTKKGG